MMHNRSHSAAGLCMYCLLPLLQSYAELYIAGDMSGSVRSSPPHSGQWSNIYTSESLVNFSDFVVSWNASVPSCNQLPDDPLLTVTVAVSNDTLVWTPEATIPTSGSRPTQTLLPMAHHYRVTVKLTRCPANDDRSPEVFAVTLSDGRCHADDLPLLQGGQWPLSSCKDIASNATCSGSCDPGFTGSPVLSCYAGNFTASGTCSPIIGKNDQLIPWMCTLFVLLGMQ
jgi:hypothetical protein